MMIKKPIHKLNGGNAATLCIKCSVVICTGLKDILYCDNCKKKAMNKIVIVVVIWETTKYFAKKIWYHLHNKF